MRDLLLWIFAACVFSGSVNAQVRREFPSAPGSTLEIINRHGKVLVSTSTDAEEHLSQAGILTATGTNTVSDSDLAITNAKGDVKIEVRPAKTVDRVDLSLTVPKRSRLKITTVDGEIRVAGDVELLEAATDTGTIAADVPDTDVKYEFIWRESRPRFLSDFELEKVKEGSAGRFSIRGRHSPMTDGSRPNVRLSENGDTEGKRDDRGDVTVNLKFTTSRGIVLLNIPPNEVMSDLRERPLTRAAKAIIRSGDSVLMDSIRRASPKYFGDFMRTLPPLRREPGFTDRGTAKSVSEESVKTASIRVVDAQNRAIAGIAREELKVTENGEERDPLSIIPTSAPVNVVLLIDVSGSVDAYVTFIRKAARAFIETVDSRDKLSIVIFNEDVNEIATFSTDRGALSRSLDTFDAGGATAYYDALGYVLTDTLRSFRGERTAIVVLSDGDDNRSFLPFDSLAGSIEESGALIYPLYVPSNLIAAATSDPDSALDPLRSRYLSNDITTKADSEGKRLAEISGGVYYPITQLSQIQTAYDDIVVQLRTAYDVTFASRISTPDGRPSPRLKIRTTRPGSYVQIRSVREHKP